MNVSTFRQKQRDLLGDTTQGSQTFEDRQLDGWRDDEVGKLYARGLFKKDTNIGTETTIGSVTPVAIYYTMPTAWRRVHRVEFVDATDATLIEGRSYGYDDLERPGYIRIPEAPNFSGYKIRLFGEVEYTAVDDAAMKQEVHDVLLYGSCLRAMVSAMVMRAERRRALSTSRKADTFPRDLVMTVSKFEQLLQEAVALALAIQARTVLGG